MKIQVMRLGKANENHIVPEFENEQGWFVVLTGESGVSIEIQETVGGVFQVRSLGIHMLNIEPQSSNTILLRGKMMGCGA